MKKSGAVICILMVSILIISTISFASANLLSDIWGKITGNVAKIIKSQKEITLCTDSDGGDNKLAKGIVVYTEVGKNKTKNFTDFCQNKYIFSKNSKMLREYFCNPINKTIIKNYECELGCEDGACLQNPVEEPL